MALGDLVRFINAIQAMPGGGTLTVTTEEAPSCQQSLGWHHTKDDWLDSRQKIAGMTGGGFVTISIKDTGMGIPKDKLDKIFDPFFTTKEDGTGLGLSIVHGIIKSHHGNIKASSREGFGSEFIISLPGLES